MIQQKNKHKQHLLLGNFSRSFVCRQPIVPVCVVLVCLRLNPCFQSESEFRMPYKLVLSWQKPKLLLLLLLGMPSKLLVPDRRRLMPCP